MARSARHGFWRRHGSTRLTLAPAERELLLDLCAGLAALIAPKDDGPRDPLAELVGIDADARTPEDPAVLRLFPDAYRDDRQAAAEFRRFTQRGLQHVKTERLERVQAVLAQPSDGGEQVRDTTVVLDAADQQAFLGAVNDMRLVLGSRLGIEADDQDVTAGWEPADPRMQQHDIYQWLTWLQSSLLDTMSR